MQRFKTISLVLFYIGCLSTTAWSQPSVLNSGKWFRISTAQNGVYRVTADQLKSMGFNIATLDPRNIRIYGSGGGMLPQQNDVPRSPGLQETAIHVSGEEDGKLNNGDFILFYAEGPDRVAFDAARTIYSYDNNLYSDRNFYFVTVADSPGKRIQTSGSENGTYPQLAQYHDYWYHESDEANILNSGREWFGERFDQTGDRVFNLPLSGIPADGTIKIVSDVMARSHPTASSFDVYVNSQLAGQQPVSATPNPLNKYSLQGRHKRDTLTLSAASVNAAGRNTQEIKYRYNRNGTGAGYLDFFLVSYVRKIALYENQTIFNSALAVDALTTVMVDAVSSDVDIWDVSDPFDAKRQPFTIAGGQASFSTTCIPTRSFIVFNTNIPSPELIDPVDPQNLRGMAPVNFIIVSPEEFRPEAERLALHRQTQRQWTAVVVTPQEIYNEFSSGRQDVGAIRDFVKSLYDKGPDVVKALLLFGKASYDYKDRLNGNTNFVPTYESRNSLDPLETYSSDDFFGFLENGKGKWSESPAQNEVLDIGVGRLPVKTVAEAKTVVDKIIGYDTGKKIYGGWRKEIVFIADDGSTTDGFTSEHQSQANRMAEDIETLTPEFNTQKVFLGTYQKKASPNGETIPDANEDILRKIERGALILNYTGHGSEKLWADEKIFSDVEIQDLENRLYPFLVTATCEFGRQDDPQQISSAELSILHANGGAIGLVTTARPVYSFTNFELNKAFYEALFVRDGDDRRTLGEIFRDTKNNSASGVGNRNFSLLADPSMTLAMPHFSMAVTSIATASGADTLKALSTVTVRGEIQDVAGSKIADFNGEAEAVVFDKKTDFTTVGRNDPAFKFKSWYSALFRGRATVKDGSFEFQFMVPKNMAYEIGPGKISLYAVDDNHALDAAGASTNFKIGGSEIGPQSDNAAPLIKPYIGDTTFINGGITSPRTNLVVRLEDESGINISNYGIGNTLIAILDDNDQVFVLSDHYAADKDTYKKGWINFPLLNLSPGKHTLTIKAWDIYNNPGQAQIDFIVSDGEALVIESFGNYPNPFDNETTLYFNHNRSGDDLAGEVSIYDSRGHQLKTYTFMVPASGYQVDVVELNGLNDFGQKLPRGLYFARLAVRSLSNGSKNEQVTKLIVVN